MEVDKVKSTIQLVTGSATGTIQALCAVGKEVWCGSTNTISIWDETATTLKKEIQEAHKGIVCALLLIDLDAVERELQFESLQSRSVSSPQGPLSRKTHAFSSSPLNTPTAKVRATTVSGAPIPSVVTQFPSPSTSNVRASFLQFPVSKYSIAKKTVWSASWDGSIKMWDTREFNDYVCQRILVPDDLTKPQPVTSLCLVRDRVWSGTQHHLFLWSLIGDKLGRIDLPDLPDNALQCPPSAIVHDGQYVWAAVDRHIVVYAGNLNPAKPNRPLKVLSNHSDRILCLAYANGYVWSGDNSGDLFVWDCDSLELVQQIKAAHTGSIFCMCSIRFHTSTSELWTAGRDDVVRVWDIENYICTSALAQPDNDHIFSMLYVDHTSQVWTGSHSLRIWSDDKNLFTNVRMVTYDNKDKYVGEFKSLNNNSEQIIRHGKGEMHCASGEIYVGYWVNDKRYGYGIVTYANKDKYYGDWQDDLRTGRGVYVHHDGTIFDGNWKKGVRKGPGTMYFPNGDKIEAVWKNDTQFSDAVFTKGDLTKIPRCIQELFTNQNELSLKKTRDQPTRTIPALKWFDFTPSHIKQVERRLKEKFPSKKCTLKDLSIMLSDETDALGHMIADFCSMFNASYHYSYGDAQTLLYNAIDDIHSFLSYMENCVLNLIPSMKKRDCVMLITNILFTKVYISLFSLFKEVYQNRDGFFSVKIHSLRGITLDTIGVKKKFWLGYDPSRTDELSAFEDDSNEYSGVIHKLRQLSELKTVTKKINCLIEAAKYVVRCVDEFYNPENRLGAEVDQTKATPKTGLNADNNNNSGNNINPTVVAARKSLDVMLKPVDLHLNLNNEPLQIKEDSESPTPESSSESIQASRYDSVASFDTILPIGSPKASPSNSSSEESVIAIDSKDSQDSVADLEQHLQKKEQVVDALALGAEDKFPILLYCLIKANIPNLYSELMFVKEFANPLIVREEAQYRLIELEQAMIYIESLDWNVFDEEGVLISISFLDKKVTDALKVGRSTFFQKRNEFPRLIWLAEILLLCGTRRGEKYDDLQLGKQYMEKLREPEYFELAKSVLEPLGLKLVMDSGKSVIKFEHAFPLYLYTKMSGLVEQEIKRAHW